MGLLLTFADVRQQVAAKKPFVQTLSVGTKFVPASPAWAQIDSSLVLPAMFQEIIN